MRAPQNPGASRRSQGRIRSFINALTHGGKVLAACFVVAVAITLLLFFDIFRETMLILVLSIVAYTWISIVLYKRRERRWNERFGRACVRCGQEMNGNIHGTCPKCGLEWATHRRSIGPWGALWSIGSYSIRHAQPADIERHASTWQHCDRSAALSMDVDRLHELFGPDGVIWLIAERDGHVCGHILLLTVVVRLDKPTADGPCTADAFAVEAFGGDLANWPHDVPTEALAIAAFREASERGCRRVVVYDRCDFIRFGFRDLDSTKLRASFGEAHKWLALELVPGGLDNCAGEIEYPPRALGS
ncbi:MAG: hypothetical protein KF838_09245 [Phycisphaeraceae bacterium]|nr:MAG: hypothetical protein KF838_09245 [Phycisphaeraceae bacterium]